MSLASPLLLLIGLVVLAALVAYALVQGRRKRYAMRFTNLDLLAGVVAESPGWRRHIPPVLFLLAMAALVVALARPQATVKVPKETATVMLATDASGSMMATDVDPSRLAAARKAAKAFAKGLPAKFRLGLVSFDNSAEVLVPPTTDRTAVENALDGVRSSGGTAMGDALALSLRALKPAPGTDEGSGGGSGRDSKRPPAVVVLLSDGDNTAGSADPADVARQARAAGVPINTVALGTDAGTVEVPTPDGGLTTVPVPPDRDLLRQIAEITNGRAFDASDAGELDEIYESLGTRIGFDKDKREITQYFAAGGLGLLVLAGGLSLVWFGRLP